MQVILLGTGAALPGPDRENTFLVVRGEHSSILVDCGGSPMHRLAKAGVPHESINEVILTHDHADHIYGYPIFIMDLWLAGRKKELHVYGLFSALATAQALMAAFRVETWKNLFPIQYHPIPVENIDLILLNRECTVSATCGQHYVPSMSLRFVSKASGGAVVYSADTAPNEAILELARDAEILFHEATFLNESTEGHTNAYQAGAQAVRAGVKKLVLLHLPPDVDPLVWRTAAKQEFHGPVQVARDFDTFEF